MPSPPRSWQTPEMKSLKTLSLLLAAAATPLLAVPAVPEISGDFSGALALIGGLTLVLRTRRRK